MSPDLEGMHSTMLAFTMICLSVDYITYFFIVKKLSSLQWRYLSTQLADLKQQILQKMILLRSTSPEVQNDLGDRWIILYA